MSAPWGGGGGHLTDTPRPIFVFMLLSFKSPLYILDNSPYQNIFCKNSSSHCWTFSFSVAEVCLLEVFGNRRAHHGQFLPRRNLLNSKADALSLTCLQPPQTQGFTHTHTRIYMQTHTHTHTHAPVLHCSSSAAGQCNFELLPPRIGVCLFPYLLNL
jgi:hypothetical protein